MGPRTHGNTGVILDVRFDPPRWDDYRPLRLITGRGEVKCRLYRVPDARRGAVWVGGVGGGWDTPARGLYPRLCDELTAEGISSLRIRYRNPHDLAEAVHDVRVGLSYLAQLGIRHVALIGHSFGGAVVIRAAASVASVRTVVTLATQAYGAEPAARLSPNCSLLLIHGTADLVLPVQCSQRIHRMAGDPRQLVVYPGAGHVLDEVADEVYQLIRMWVISELQAASSDGA